MLPIREWLEMNMAGGTLKTVNSIVNIREWRTMNTAGGILKMVC